MADRLWTLPATAFCVVLSLAACAPTGEQRSDDTSARATFMAGAAASRPAPTPLPGSLSANNQGASVATRPTTISTRSADETALDGACALAASDTAVDQDPHDTAERAVADGLLTPVFARQVLVARIDEGPGSEWSSWATHRAFLSVHAELSGDDHPADTDDFAARTVLLTITPVGRDGWRGRPSLSSVVIVLEKINGNWRVASDQPN